MCLFNSSTMNSKCWLFWSHFSRLPLTKWALPYSFLISLLPESVTVACNLTVQLLKGRWQLAKRKRGSGVEGGDPRSWLGLPKYGWKIQGGSKHCFWPHCLNVFVILFSVFWIPTTVISKFRNKYTVKSTVKMFILPTTDLPIAAAERYIQLNVD